MFLCLQKREGCRNIEAIMKSPYHYKLGWKRFLAGVFDVFGGAVFFLVRKFVKAPEAKDIKKILVIRADHIGDVVMTRPAIRSLHKKFPHAEIDLLVDGKIAPLFEDSSKFHQVLKIHHSWFSPEKNFGAKWREFWRLKRFLTKIGYDVAFDFRGDVRHILLMALCHIPYRYGFGVTGGGFLLTENTPYDDSIHQVLLNLSLLKSFQTPQDNKLLPFEYTRERAATFWKNIGEISLATDLPRVVIHMGAGTAAKRWGTDDYRALIHQLDSGNRAQMILIGTESERELLSDLKLNTAHLIDLRGRTRIEDLPILFDVCDLYVGADSGPAHIAAAHGLEIILLASGTNDIRFWYPWTEHLHILQHEVPCAPCGLRVCPVEGHPCMSEISVDQVYDAVEGVLKKFKNR